MFTDSRESRAAIMTYLIEIVADALQAEESDIRESDPSESLGLTSVQNMTIVARLNEDIGDIPETLLFDRLSLSSLAEYLATDRFADMAKIVHLEC